MRACNTAAANEQSLVCVQLEHEAAIRNADGILKVEGVDVFFIGPSDLSQSMGHPGNPNAPVVAQAIAETRAIMQNQIPRDFDPRALMNKRFAVDLGVEHAQPEKAPFVERLRRPHAKNRPAKFPEQTHKALAPGPR